MSGTGHSDLGDILIMPTTGPLKLNPGTSDNPDSGYRSRFTHDTEKAAPGYYEVKLDDYGVKVQLTATQRVGVHKYTFPVDKEGRIVLDFQKVKPFSASAGCRAPCVRRFSAHFTVLH